MTLGSVMAEMTFMREPQWVHDNTSMAKTRAISGPHARDHKEWITRRVTVHKFDQGGWHIGRSQHRVQHPFGEFLGETLHVDHVYTLGLHQCKQIVKDLVGAIGAEQKHPPNG
jgi:hypothetical protein